ncbi:MAG: hypothetical protein H6835_12905 [Planctomycetes bacterium]|nr:hypothetical protein [Planctomycetota bacterium]
MNARRLLVFLVVVFALFGCKNGRGGGNGVDVPAVVAATVLGGGPVVLNPLLTTVLALGAIEIRNDTPAGTPDRDIDFVIDCPAGVDCSEFSGRLAPGEARVIQVLTTLATVAVVAITVRTIYALGGAERVIPVQWQNLAVGSRALALFTLISSPLFAPLWFAATALMPTGVLTKNSNPLVPQRLPALAQEVRLIGAIIGILTLIELQQLFGGGTPFVGSDGAGPEFPLGAGPNGLTLATEPAATMAEGEYIAFYLSVSEDIPQASTSEFFQYAFVCDSDADPSNNFVASPAFADDFFAGTDRWYELTYAPTSGWAFRCKVVGAGNTITTVPSAARAILSEDTLIVLAPRSEFGVDHPAFRATTFAHKGDFGQNAPFDWSGDPSPTVDEPLLSWQ